MSDTLQRAVWDGHPVSLGVGFARRPPAPSRRGFCMCLRTPLRTVCGPLAIALILANPMRAYAAVISLTAADSAGTSLITFDGIPDGTPVNGMTVDGVQFNYFVNNVASNALVVDGGPGMTNNVSRPNLVNPPGGNANALLRLTFAEPEERLGYGFAVLTNLLIPDATTVTLFDGTDVMVGVLSAPPGSRC
jgi:hypothetical protein